jgi:hypothetical protein
LFFKPAERIVVTLNLIADKMPVNHGDVGSAFPMIQAKLVNHKRILLGMLPS